MTAITKGLPDGWSITTSGKGDRVQYELLKDGVCVAGGYKYSWHIIHNEEDRKYDGDHYKPLHVMKEDWGIYYIYAPDTKSIINRVMDDFRKHNEYARIALEVASVNRKIQEGEVRAEAARRAIFGGNS